MTKRLESIIHNKLQGVSSCHADRHQKAASETACEALLNASFQVEKPFSTPVLFVDPADYAPRKFLGMQFFDNHKKALLKEKLAAFAENCDTPDPKTLKELAGRDYDSRSIAQIGDALVRTLNTHFKYKDKLMAYALPVLFPRLSIALYTVAKDVARIHAAEFLRTETPLPDYPGFDSQYNFNSLWHEIAHSIAGDNEAGAELTAALACRYAFEDCTFLSVQADLRVAEVILGYNNPKALNNYGWACVEAVEAAIALDTAPGREAVRNVGENSWRVPRIDRSKSIVEVAGRLHMAVGEDGWGTCRMLDELADTTGQLIEKNAFRTAEQKTIASRFVLAAQRLVTGTPAYAQTPRPTAEPEQLSPIQKFLCDFI